MADSETPLSKISKILQDDDFATFMPEVSEENPIEQLYVSLGQDSQKRDLILQMLFINDLASKMGMEEEPEDAVLLQCFLAFPVVCKQEHIGEIAKLMVTLNRIIPIGALGTSLKEGTLYYQYVLALETREAPAKVILEVISMIGMFTMEFADKLAAVARGQKTCDNIICELEEAGLTIPPVMPPPGAEGA